MIGKGGEEQVYFIASIFEDELAAKPDVFGKYVDGLTAAHFAAYEGNVAALKKMSPQQLTAADANGFSAIHFLMQKVDKSLITDFVGSGYITAEFDYNGGNTLLHLACEYNCYEIITGLLQFEGFEINKENDNGQTAFDIAIVRCNKNLDILNAMKDKGCKINADKLSFAIPDLENLGYMQWLMANLANVLEDPSQENIKAVRDRAIIAAISLNRHEALRILLGKDKYAVDKSFFTLSLFNGKLDVLKVLLEHATPVDTSKDASKRDDSWLYEIEDVRDDIDLRSKIYYKSHLWGHYISVSTAFVASSLASSLAVQQTPLYEMSPVAAFVVAMAVTGFVTYATSNWYTNSISTPRLIKQLQDLKSETPVITQQQADKVEESEPLSDVQKQFIAACMKEDCKTVGTLLSGENKEEVLAATTINGLKGVHLAAYLGHEDVLACFGVDVVKNTLDAKGRTPFALSLLGGTKSGVRYFRDSVLQNEERDVNNQSPLTVVLRYGSKDNIDAWIKKHPINDGAKYSMAESAAHLAALSESTLGKYRKACFVSSLKKHWDFSEANIDDGVKNSIFQSITRDSSLIDAVMNGNNELAAKAIAHFSAENNIAMLNKLMEYAESKTKCAAVADIHHKDVAKAVLEYVKNDRNAVSMLVVNAWCNNPKWLSETCYSRENKIKNVLGFVSASAVCYIASEKLDLGWASPVIGGATAYAVAYLYGEYRMNPAVAESIRDM